VFWTDVCVLVYTLPLACPSTTSASGSMSAGAHGLSRTINAIILIWFPDGWLCAHDGCSHPYHTRTTPDPHPNPDHPRTSPRPFAKHFANDCLPGLSSAFGMSFHHICFLLAVHRVNSACPENINPVTFIWFPDGWSCAHDGCSHPSHTRTTPEP
jgi:hypothetical protein